MKIAFFTMLSENNKMGLFNATHDRIKQFQINGISFKVFNMRIKDNIILKDIKIIFNILLNKDYKNEIEPEFVYDSINYENFYLKRNLISVLSYKLNLKEHPYSIKSISKLSLQLKDYTLVSAHWGGIPAMIAYLIKKKMNKPYFVTYHGSDITVMPNINFKSKQEILRILYNSSRNIFVGKTLLNKSIELGHFKNNNIVIYNSLSIDFINKAKLNKNNCNNNKEKSVAFIGNLVDVKNADLLPEIFNNIKKLNNKIKFYIIGDGILYDKIKREGEAYKLDLTFTGKISREDVLRHLKKIDILILPSKSEGLPLILLEAISSGVMCIGSNVGGIPEVLGTENVVDLGPDFIKNISELSIKKLFLEKEIPILDNKFLIENSFKKEYEVYTEVL